MRDMCGSGPGKRDALGTRELLKREGDSFRSLCHDRCLWPWLESPWGRSVVRSVEAQMKVHLIAAALVLGLGPIGASSASAEGVLLTPPEARAYHACLHEAWVQDWCHGNSGRPSANYERVFAACVVAYGGGRFPLDGRHWGNTDDYCWAAAHTVVWEGR